MPKALIYSQDFDGHRQVYVFVLAHTLHSLGFDVFIAGNIKQKLYNSMYFDRIKEIKGFYFIDTSFYSEPGNAMTYVEFLDLQNKCECDLTVFSDADDQLALFNSQIFKKRLRGKLIGIFLRPFFFYDKLSLFEKLRYLKHLPTEWKNDNRLFHKIFLKRFSLLDVALYLDENFVAHSMYGLWLPDVFQQYADLLVWNEKSSQRIFIDKLNVFKEENKGRFMFLYFGTAQFRRGYDILLKMAVENGGCFIHCGLNPGTEKYSFDINELRLLLEKSGRLFETNQYIDDPECIKHFFKSISHLILPYRNFDGSSGVMLQALGFGIPVLAPDRGIIGYRINKYQLGVTYEYNSFVSLNAQFNKFIKNNPHNYEKNINAYMSYQSPEQLQKVLVNSFSDLNEVVKQP